MLSIINCNGRIFSRKHSSVSCSGRLPSPRAVTRRPGGPSRGDLLGAAGIGEGVHQSPGLAQIMLNGTPFLWYGDLNGLGSIKADIHEKISKYRIPKHILINYHVF